MFDSPLVALALVVSVIGILAAPETGSLVTFGALGTVALLAIAAATLFSELASHLPPGAASRLRRLRRAIEVCPVPSQSHPDAPGRSRPRAPGSAAVAA